MRINNSTNKFIYTHMGSSFVLEPYNNGYRICGLDLAADEIWFPDNYMGKSIVPWVALNQCSNPHIPEFHHFDNVRRLHIPEWMSSFDAHNYLFPRLEEIKIHSSPNNSHLSSIGPLLFSGQELIRVYSAGYRDCFTFPIQVKRVGCGAFAYTTITNIQFDSPYIIFDRDAFYCSQINHLIQSGEKQFITFGNLLYRCVYADSKKLTIPAHVQFFEKNAFSLTYFKKSDGSKALDFCNNVEEIESPVPIMVNMHFLNVKKLLFHSFNIDNNHLFDFLNFPNLEWLEILTDRIKDRKTKYATVQGVLFTKDMKTLVKYPNHPREEYTVPDGVQTIHDYAFQNHPYLKKIHLPESIRTIGKFAFAYSAIEEITLSHGINTIERYAIQRTKVKEIHLPKCIKKIGIGALSGICKIHCFEGSCNGLFKSFKHSNHTALFKNNVEIEITRINGELLRIIIPCNLSSDGLDYLDNAWENSAFDIQVYQKCFSYIKVPIERYRFAYRIFKELDKKSVFGTYLKRIALKFAQILISENAVEELIQLLNDRLLSAPSLRKLLDYVQDREITTLNAYILQALSECNEKRKTLRL